MSLERSSPIPLYYQLKQAILEKINTDVWHAGEGIPAERELQEQYGVSRTTVRQAVGELVDEGRLFRRAGVGTFVAKPKIRHGPQRPYGLSGFLKAQGLEPGWKVKYMEVVRPSSEAEDALQLGRDDEVLRIGRIRLAENEAVGLHTIFLPFPPAERVSADQMLRGESSLSYLIDELGIEISETHRIIRAKAATHEEAETLKMRIGEPILQIRRTAISAAGKPVEFLEASYCGERFEYYIHFEI